MNETAHLHLPLPTRTLCHLALGDRFPRAVVLKLLSRQMLMLLRKSLTDAATNEADHGLSNHSAVDMVLPIQSKLVQMSNHSAVNTGPTTNYDYIFADIYDTLRFARNDEYPLRGKRSRNGRGRFRNNSKRTLNYPK